MEEYSPRQLPRPSPHRFSGPVVIPGRATRGLGPTLECPAAVVEPRRVAGSAAATGEPPAAVVIAARSAAAGRWLAAEDATGILVFGAEGADEEEHRQRSRELDDATSERGSLGVHCGGFFRIQRIEGPLDLSL